jgi:hypothetical protein
MKNVLGEQARNPANREFLARLDEALVPTSLSMSIDEELPTFVAHNVLVPVLAAQLLARGEGRVEGIIDAADELRISVRAFVREACEWNGNPYDDRHFWAALADAMRIPVALSRFRQEVLDIRNGARERGWRRGFQCFSTSSILSAIPVFLAKVFKDPSMLAHVIHAPLQLLAMKEGAYLFYLVNSTLLSRQEKLGEYWTTLTKEASREC